MENDSNISSEKKVITLRGLLGRIHAIYFEPLPSENKKPLIL
jgi:hypothetical protein